jgi:hypothetical protein
MAGLHVDDKGLRVLEKLREGFGRRCREGQLLLAQGLTGDALWLHAEAYALALKDHTSLYACEVAGANKRVSVLRAKKLGVQSKLVHGSLRGVGKMVNVAGSKCDRKNVSVFLYLLASASGRKL